MLQSAPTMFLFSETVNSREAEVNADATARLLFSLVAKVRNLFGGKKAEADDEFTLAA